MIDLARDVLGGFLVLAGAAFFLIGAIGVNRMPELFTRLHAASLSDTAGAALTLVGLMFYGGFTLVTAKLVFLLLFLLFMGPAATHALAAAALQSGLKPRNMREVADARSGRAPAKHAPGGVVRKTARKRR